MKSTDFQPITAVLLLCCSSYSFAGSLSNDIIFNNDFDFTSKLNDSGIVWAADYSSGNSNDCSSNIAAGQDCNFGRDVTHNDNSDGFAGFSYTKIDFNGNSLPASSVTWSCVLDNVTGLLWEKKSTDNGIHDKDLSYKWGGITAAGYNHPNREGPYYDDWDVLVNGSNTENFCGKSNWKIPSVNELSSIIHHGVSIPSIESDYFPNGIATWYWTSAAYIIDNSDAWNIYFGEGNINAAVRHVTLKVRLVSPNF